MVSVAPRVKVVELMFNWLPDVAMAPSIRFSVVLVPSASVGRQSLNHPAVPVAPQTPFQVSPAAFERTPATESSKVIPVAPPFLIVTRRAPDGAVSAVAG